MSRTTCRAGTRQTHRRACKCYPCRMYGPIDFEKWAYAIGALALTLPVLAHRMGHSHPRGTVIDYMTPSAATRPEIAAAIEYLQDLTAFGGHVTKQIIGKWFPVELTSPIPFAAHDVR
mgnify:CR=1 FL=1